VDWKILRACDYGAPTIRKRLFLVARRDGLPITWPKPTHGDPASPAVRRGKLQPYRTAAECIDWSIPCPSIFDRERPLAENTLKRIAKGVMRYVVENGNPFIVPIANYGNGSSIVNDIGEPLRTITAWPKGGSFAVVAPHITKFRTGAVGHGCDEPMHTITANSNATDSTANPGGCAPFGLVSATVVGCGGRAGQSRPRSPDEPFATVTTKADACVVSAFLAKHYGGVVGADLRQPLPTITATDHNAPVAVSLLNLKGSDRGGSDITQPMPTICAGGTHAAAVAAFLAPYYGSGSGETGRDMRAPAPTITTKDRFQLVTVTIGGEQYAIVDIGMRMLQPHELAAAQGFPASYQFAEVEGKPVPKYAQVRLIGNSVCPPLAKAIVEANFTHEKKFMAAPAVAA